MSDPASSHPGVFRLTLVPYEPEHALRIRVQLALGRVLQCPLCTEVLRHDPPAGTGDDAVIAMRCDRCRREAFIRPNSTFPEALG